ncbi:DUF2634 domain-containing protein [Paenibacillus macerans]|uniref:DUF2634 domain-containing protein n=1 Tax=Paenibacillus macerans TaxID=44252 RepID=UPI003D31A892
MISLKLDESGDLVFQNGELVMISGDADLMQSCRLAIGTNKGEWFLDPTAGITFSKFLGKKISEDEMRDELRAGLLQEPRIRSVDEITFDIDRKSRKMTVRFTASGMDGELIRSEGVDVVAG